MESSDLTQKEYLEKAETLGIAFPGCNIYQKFTCGHCNSRQTMEKPNIWYNSGTCEECGYLNIIERAGMLLVANTKLRI